MIKTYKKAALPWLHEWMLAKKASNAALAAKSGVSLSTIGSMRAGTAVQLHILGYVVEALNAYEYSYKKRGPERMYYNE